MTQQTQETKINYKIRGNKIIYTDTHGFDTTWSDKDVEKAYKSTKSGFHSFLYKELGDHDQVKTLLLVLQTELKQKNKKKSQKEERISPDKLPPEIPFEELLRRAPYLNDKTILEACIITIANKPSKNPLWLMLVAPPASGKTTACRLLNTKGYTYRVSTMTTQAFSPGSARDEETSKTFALLDLVSDSTLIIDDMSAILGQDPRTMNKILGEMTAMYGEDFSKFSPGLGLHKHAGSWNLIVGITPQLLDAHRKVMSKFGQRFLVRMFDENEDIKLDNPISDKKWKYLLNRTIISARLRRKEIKITDGDEELIMEAAKQIAYIRSWRERLVEGRLRLYHQCRNFCITKAALYNREVNTEDIYHFIEIALQTTPNYEFLAAFKDGPLNYQQAAIKSGISPRNAKFNQLIPLLSKGILVECENDRHTLNLDFWIFDVFQDERNRELKPNKKFDFETEFYEA